MAAGHLVADRDLSFLGDIDADGLMHSRRKLIAVFAAEYLRIHHYAVFTVWHLQGSIPDFTLFFTENGAQQTLFGRQLRLAFRGHFSHQDIAGTHFRAYPDDTPVVQVFQSLVADAWHVPCDLFRTQLCVAGLGFIFFNMYGCIDIIPDKALGQKNRVLIVITFPGHKADQRILAESEFASAG